MNQFFHPARSIFLNRKCFVIERGELSVPVIIAAFESGRISGFAEHAPHMGRLAHFTGLLVRAGSLLPGYMSAHKANLAGTPNGFMASPISAGNRAIVFGSLQFMILIDRLNPFAAVIYNFVGVVIADAFSN